ncbi:hypothetical protein LENED_011449 [Lentinula edodes]|uniref:Uncharacterized protein n=1 Tax=Lentinula edodes TaxID=5353 RepID=A0A1Q3EQ26_LENED|nr:hypothetical protein LENED_011449 [Lentinula edodes]
MSLFEIHQSFRRRHSEWIRDSVDSSAHINSQTVARRNSISLSWRTLSWKLRVDLNVYLGSVVADCFPI